MRAARKAFHVKLAKVTFRQGLARRIIFPSPKARAAFTPATLVKSAAHFRDYRRGVYFFFTADYSK
jgi:hypothetical protein